MTNSNEEKPEHPGKHIRNDILPKGLSIKKAAEFLDVGRQALSDLLNEKASLSPEMATRLEKGFPEKANRAELLKLQENFDAPELRAKESGWAVRRYAEDFLKIRSTNIEAYFKERPRPRQELAAFLRKLVTTTNKGIIEKSFPAFDDAELKGWDGKLDTTSASPYIPLGRSGWEFGTNKDPTQKANDDFKARTTNVPEAEQRATTFVFVTPLKWKDKESWIAKKKAEGNWKGVRAYDATDLEQWLEQSAPAQCWFGELIGLDQDLDGIKTLEHCWNEWANATTPNLTEALFKDSVESFKDKPLKEWLENKPDKAIIVEADSNLEAQAFLFSVFNSSPQKIHDRCIVIESAKAYKKIKRVGSEFISIISSEDAEKLAAGSEHDQHIIIIRQKGSSEKKPDISLDKPGPTSFKEALAQMGIEDQDADRYARESGRSPSILRRRLSFNEAIKSPPWAKEDYITQNIVPFILAGQWDIRKDGDKEAVNFLCGYKDYKSVEQVFARILKAKETPLYASNAIRKVSAKIDALFAVRNFVTEDHIKDFLFIAENIISDADPALDLPEDQRPFAVLYGKVRQHSSHLRGSICDTLIILSVFGKDLFSGRFSLDVESEVICLIRRLLDTGRKNRWIEHKHELPSYAEAAPHEFLSILEEDLQKDSPEIFSLIQPVKSGMFEACPRSGLLWALETLAWKPENLPRICLILAKLSKQELDDNYINKPINTLVSIFRSWMPQTNANVEERIRALELIIRRHPEIGWKLCMSQLETGSRTGHYNNRPNWRSDASGAGQPVTRGEAYSFEKYALERTLNWPIHDEHTLGELISRVQIMGDEYCDILWKQVDNWLAKNPDEVTKATLRETIRKFAFTRRGHKHLRPKSRSKAKDAFTRLAPGDVVYRHLWLFEKQWVEESYEDLEEDEFDYKKWENRVFELRRQALEEIFYTKGENGLEELLEKGECGHPIGWILAAKVLTKPRLKSLIRKLSEREYPSSHSEQQSCLGGILSQVAHNDEKYYNKYFPQLITCYLECGNIEPVINALRAAPFSPTTWQHLDLLPPDVQKRYWKYAVPRWFGKNAEGVKTMIDNLLDANRAMDAFGVAHLEWEIVRSEDIVRMLEALGNEDIANACYYDLREYDLTQAFNVLNSRSDVSTEKLAKLEFKYAKVFRLSEYKLPNLSKQISEQPIMYVQALAIAYKRSDDQPDPEELGLGDNAKNQELISAAHSLIDNVSRIPGTQADGSINEIDLSNWLTETRSLCRKYAREKIGDHMIGQFLSQSPVGKDGIWPCEPVREALEKIASSEISSGIRIGIYNSRGATFRDPSNPEERRLARKYRKWSREIVYEYPYVADVLEGIARSYDRDAEIWGIEDDLFN